MNGKQIFGIKAHSDRSVWQIHPFARRGIKIAIALSLIGAGAALGQSSGFAPPKMPTMPSLVVPDPQGIKNAPAPGSQREARACSQDIANLCAAQTITRRNVLACFKSKDQQVSQSCKAFIQRGVVEMSDGLD